MLCAYFCCFVTFSSRFFVSCVARFHRFFRRLTDRLQAAGRDVDGLSDNRPPLLYGASSEFEIGVPVYREGILRYTLAGMLSACEPDADFFSWTTLRPPLLDADADADLLSPYPPPTLPPPQARPQPPSLHPGQPLPHGLVQEHQQLPQFPQAPQHPPHLAQQQLYQHSLLRIPGSSPGRPGVKMQLPPHTASSTFPVPTAAGVGDIVATGHPGMPLY